MRLDLEALRSELRRFARLTEVHLALRQARQRPDVVRIELDHPPAVLRALREPAQDEPGDGPLIVGLRELRRTGDQPEARRSPRPAAGCR